jgi:hypothetical protein
LVVLPVQAFVYFLLEFQVELSGLIRDPFFVLDYFQGLAEILLGLFEDLLAFFEDCLSFELLTLCFFIDFLGVLILIIPGV